jgi:transcriptional regulator with XRE-family HTH domain
LTRRAFPVGLEKLSKVAEMESFGTRFGRLVRDKRGIEGMSQDQLAANTGLTKSRVSELETGKVGNPHTKTVDALCVALNISREEREYCHTPPHSGLPHLLLENLALRFGYDNPDSLEDDLANFLRNKACEYQAMRERLAKMDVIEGQIVASLADVERAIERGDFVGADEYLAKAESVQLTAKTLPAIEAQYKFRFERGNAALLAGEITHAARHWEKASSYYHFFEPKMEAEKTHEHCQLLREYAYRYKNVQALHEAERKAKISLSIWNERDDIENWCKTKISLGGIRCRLSQFDIDSHSSIHLAEARSHYEVVYERSSPSLLAYYYAQACVNLANIYSDLEYADSDERQKNLKKSLKFQQSALALLTKENQPEEWGILHHNLALTYIGLFEIGGHVSLEEIDSAIRHLESSFEVRNTDDSLQYWIASSRSLGEALTNRAMCATNKYGKQDLDKSSCILHAALSKISQEEHPNQWQQLREQLRLCAELLNTIEN